MSAKKAKADKSTSTRCSLCDKPIAAARLQALPGVTTCIDCARKHPQKFDPSKVDLSEASQIDRTGFARSD